MIKRGGNMAITNKIAKNNLDEYNQRKRTI